MLPSKSSATAKMFSFLSESSGKWQQFAILPVKQSLLDRSHPDPAHGRLRRKTEHDCRKFAQKSFERFSLHPAAQARIGPGPDRPIRRLENGRFFRTRPGPSFVRDWVRIFHRRSSQNCLRLTDNHMPPSLALRYALISWLWPLGSGMLASLYSIPSKRTIPFGCRARCNRLSSG